MSEAELIQSRQGPVLEILINRPKQRNSLTRTLVRQLIDLFEMAPDDKNLRVIVLRGNGGSFCAGAELGQIDLNATPASRQKAVELSREFAAMCMAVSECSVPVISVVEGPAVGGGFGVACCTDICLGTAAAKLGFGAQRIGAVPGPIVPFVLDRAGFSMTKLLAVTRKILPAEKALSAGIVHELSDEIEGVLNQYIDHILGCGPQAVRKTKQMVLDASRDRREAMIEEACQFFGEIVTGEEAREGFEAFREKRAPAWRVSRS